MNEDKIILSYVMKDKLADEGYSILGYAGEVYSVGEAYEFIMKDTNIKKKKSIFLVGFKNEEFGVVDIFGKYSKDGLVIVHDEGVHVNGSESGYDVFNLSATASECACVISENPLAYHRLIAANRIVNFCLAGSAIKLAYIAIASYELIVAYLREHAKDSVSVKIIDALEQLSYGNISPTEAQDSIYSAYGEPATDSSIYNIANIYRSSLPEDQRTLFNAVENISYGLLGHVNGAVSAVDIVMKDAKTRISSHEYKKLTHSRAIDKYITMPDFVFACVVK